MLFNFNKWLINIVIAMMLIILLFLIGCYFVGIIEMLREKDKREKDIKIKTIQEKNNDNDKLNN